MNFFRDLARAGLRAARNILQNRWLLSGERGTSPRVLTEQEQTMLRILSEAVGPNQATCPHPNRILEVRRGGACRNWEVVAQPVQPVTRTGRRLPPFRSVLLASPSKDVAIVAARLILRARDGGEVHVLDDAGEVANRICVLNGCPTQPPLIVES